MSLVVLVNTASGSAYLLSETDAGARTCRFWTIAAWSSSTNGFETEFA